MNPYQPPTADVASSPEDARRFSHSVVAFSSAIAVPIVVAIVWWFATGKGTALDRIVHIVSNEVIGGIIAAVAVYRHKTMPLWVAALVGPVVVLMLLVSPSVWAWLLS